MNGNCWEIDVKLGGKLERITWHCGILRDIFASDMEKTNENERKINGNGRKINGIWEENK